MKNFTLCLILLLGLTVHAQLIVSNTVETPVQLVGNVLVDASVNPTNVLFNGSPGTAVRDQAAHFSTNFNPTNLGLNEGVLLTTGKATLALGPNDQGSKSDVTNYPVQGDPDLQILAGPSNTVRNAAVLEFDFVATGLELNFDYVFASEEYPEFSNTAFNDAFGFFLSGPGLSGPYTGGAVNIALVPTTTTPITINNVNNGSANAGPCEYCTYYVANGTGTTPVANPHIQYDGFTTVLRATSPLICGEIYHIKLAVANVSDNAYDSAVFLKNFRIEPLELVDNLNLPDNNSVCYGETVTIDSGLTVGTNVFTWSVNTTWDPNNPGAYDPTQFTTIAGEVGPSISVTTGGVYALTVFTDYGCQIAHDEIQIFYQPAIPMNTPQPINICTPNSLPMNVDINQTAYVSAPLTPGQYQITYYNSSAQDAHDGVPNGRIANATLTNYPVTVSPTTIWIRVEDVLVSGCVRVEPFTINISPQPSGTFNYPATPYCAALALQPVTTNVTPGGTYSATPAGLAINATTGDIDPSASTAGNYLVDYILPASGTCPQFRVDDIPVTITAAPAAPAVVTPLTYCQDEVAPALTSPGTNLTWYDLPTGGTATTTAPVPDTTIPGSKTYYVTQSNGCESPRAAIVVNVNATPAAPTFTAVAPYCQNQSASALTATGANLLWYTTATGGTGSATAPTPSTTTAGITNYYVSQTVNNCEGPRATIAVETYALPAAPGVTATIGYCAGDVPAALTATGSNLLWYGTAAGGTGSATAPTVSTTSAGSTNYFVSQTVNGCEGPRSQITVNVTAIPAAPVVASPLTYCQDELAPALSATGSSLLWYAAATGGTGSATAPVPATSAGGSTTYYVSQTTGCEGPRAAITVNVTPTPASPTVAALTYCQNEPTTALTATGTSLLWYTAATGGTGSATAPTPSSTTGGTTSYYVTQTVSGCESPRAALAVTVNTLPAAPGVTPQFAYCQGASAPVLSATGSNLLWYTTATGGTGSATAPAPSTAAIGTANYYVSQTVNGCEGARAMISVETFGIPAAPTVSVIQPTCATATATLNITAPTGVNLEYSINNGTTYQSGTTFAGVAAGTTYNVVVRHTLSGCVSSATPTVVNPALAVPPAPTVLVTQQPDCNLPSGTVTVSAPVGANYEYSLNGGATYQTGVTFAGLAPGSAQSFTVRDTNSGCVSNATAINIGPMPANPAAPTGTIVQPTCPSPTGTIDITAPLASNLEYSIDGGATYQAGTQFAALAAGVTYQVIVHNTVTGCVSSPGIFVVNAAPTFPATPVVTSADVCEGDMIALSTPSVAGATYAWTGPNGFVSTDQNPTIANASIINAGVYSLIISTGANCPSLPGSVTVAVNPIPIVTLPQDGNICYNAQTNTVLDMFTLTTDVSASDYTFAWFEQTGGTFNLISSATQSTYDVSVPGVYGVIITSIATGCASPMAIATVSMTSPPLAIEIVTSDYFEDNQVIAVNVQPSGAYEFQLDNGAFQAGNTFNNVPAGEHTVTIRNVCGQMVGEAVLIDYPRFFTPNGDGYNDTWNIFALAGQPNTKINIFDRYGKLLKEISPSGTGWDGTLNTIGLPATDYWFSVQYQQNNVTKTFKSHFALKR